MQKGKPEMIASLIKNGRRAKGLTQKELAEQAQISIRSVQRIENAALLPRSYTLKTIAGVLDIPFSAFAEAGADESNAEQQTTAFINRPRKIILSVFIPILLVLAALAFISQSGSFPETAFETFIFWGVVSILVSATLYIIWQPHKTNE